MCVTSFAFWNIVVEASFLYVMVGTSSAFSVKIIRHLSPLAFRLKPTPEHVELLWLLPACGHCLLRSAVFRDLFQKHLHTSHPLVTALLSIREHDSYLKAFLSAHIWVHTCTGIHDPRNSRIWFITCREAKRRASLWTIVILHSFRFRYELFPMH